MIEGYPIKKIKGIPILFIIDTWFTHGHCILMLKGSGEYVFHLIC